MKVNRGGRTIELRVKLGERTDAALAQFNSGGELWGATFAPLDEQSAARYGLREPVGLLVTDVTEDSAAADNGLEPGDIVLSINRQQIASFDQMQAIANALQEADRGVSLIVKRGNSRGLITIK